MNFSSRMLRGMAGLALLAFAVSFHVPAAAQTADPAAGMQRRLESVGTLIERSSAAKQIESSGSPQAAALREEARQLHARAAEAAKAGDTAGAGKLLEEASRKMFEGARLAAPEQVTSGKVKKDYEARVASVKALRDALKRSDSSSVQAKLIARVDQQLVEAEQAAAQGKLDRARSLADQAYLTIKTANRDKREGTVETVGLPVFETKEQEFHYEVDRNETFQMFSQVLLSEKRESGTLPASVDKQITEAVELRKKADAEAKAGNYEQALKTLDDSTKLLIRTIRSAGVYIPG